MRVFRDLVFRGPATAIARLLERLEEKATPGWHRDREKEKGLAHTPWPMYCFRCTKTESRAAASLWLAHKDGRELYIPNIVPDEIRELGRDQYNRILQEFYDEIALPATEGLDLQVTFTDEVATLDRWLSPQAIEKLRFFSIAANKSTGSSHPFDRDRWYDFLFTAHHEDAQLPALMLQRWLEEEEHWGGDEASELASEYETARQLLTAYDRFRA